MGLPRRRTFFSPLGLSLPADRFFLFLTPFLFAFSNLLPFLVPPSPQLLRTWDAFFSHFSPSPYWQVWSLSSAVFGSQTFPANPRLREDSPLDFFSPPFFVTFLFEIFLSVFFYKSRFPPRRGHPQTFSFPLPFPSLCVCGR